MKRLIPYSQLGVDVAETRGLKQAGLAQVQIDTFTSGFLDILVSAVTAAIP
jgi:hypothetical protein